jgi:electron transfer flavoprotein alpha subunit
LQEGSWRRAFSNGRGNGMEECRNVLIIGEADESGLSSLTIELMGIGAKLAGNLEHELHVAFLGGKPLSSIDKGYGYGADRVYAYIDPSLEDYVPDIHLLAIEQIVKELKPIIIMFGQTDRGFDLAPRLAFRMKVGVTLDCIDLRIDSAKGIMEQVKPVFGGKAHGLFQSNVFPQITAVRQGAFAPAAYDDSKQGEAIPLSLSLDPSRARTKFVSKIRDANLSLAINLAAASIVVSGGRGLRNKEGVDLMRETAELLGGAIAGSRPAVDNGWLPALLQVGLTGKRINPLLYIAVGISGSLQHMAGCLKSKMIVAINSDESAPIFKLSHVGVIGDYREVLEGFNDEVKRIRQNRGLNG